MTYILSAPRSLTQRQCLANLHNKKNDSSSLTNALHFMRHAITSLNHNIAPLSSFILRGNSTLFTLPKNASPHRMTHLIRRESACQCPLSQDKFSIIEPFFSTSFSRKSLPATRSCDVPSVAFWWKSKSTSCRRMCC